MKTILNVTSEPQLKPSVIKELNKNIKESKQGINMSPTFTSAKDAISWLQRKT